MTEDRNLRLALLNILGDAEDAKRAYEWLHQGPRPDQEAFFDRAFSNWARAGNPISVH